MKRHPLTAFVVLTAVFSWALWIPMGLAVRGAIQLPAALVPLFQIWGWTGSGLAAAILAWKLGGGEGLRRLLGRLFIWRVRYFWYLVALLFPLVISLLTTALHTMFAGDAPDFGHLPIEDTALWSPASKRALGILVMSLVLQMLGQELGWHGFLLPRLQQRFDALTSSLILAAGWALWTLPVALAVASPSGWWAPFSLLLVAIPGSILSTWIFNNTRGSLLLVLLLNAAVKATDLFVAAPAASAVVTLTPYWGAAIAIVAWAGALRLSRQPLNDNCREPLQQTMPATPGAAI